MTSMNVSDFLGEDIVSRALLHAATRIGVEHLSGRKQFEVSLTIDGHACDMREFFCRFEKHLNAEVHHIAAAYASNKLGDRLDRLHGSLNAIQRELDALALAEFPGAELDPGE